MADEINDAVQTLKKPVPVPRGRGRPLGSTKKRGRGRSKDRRFRKVKGSSVTPRRIGKVLDAADVPAPWAPKKKRAVPREGKGGLRVSRTMKYRRKAELRSFAERLYGPRGKVDGLIDTLLSERGGLNAVLANEKVKAISKKALQAELSAASYTREAMLSALSARFRAVSTGRETVGFIAKELTGSKRNPKVTSSGLKLPHAICQSTVDKEATRLYDAEKLGIIKTLDFVVGARMESVKDFIGSLIRSALVGPAPITWLDGKVNSWYVSYMGDGAPQTSSLGMVIQNMQLLNLKNHIHSSATNHTFMCADGKETDPWVFPFLQELSIELDAVEDGGIVVNGVKHNVTFVPAGDQKWLAILKGMASTSCFNDNLNFGGLSSSMFADFFIF